MYTKDVNRLCSAVNRSAVSLSRFDIVTLRLDQRFGTINLHCNAVSRSAVLILRFVISNAATRLQVSL